MSQHRLVRTAPGTLPDLPAGALLLPPVDAHRGLRGPYTAAGTIARALVPELLATRPELVHAHDVELLTVAPELHELVPASRHTLTSLAVPAERTRFYSRTRTRRLANGLAEFLRDLVRGRPGGPHGLVVLRADAAEPTDAEFLAVLLRRIDPALLMITVHVTDRPVDPELAEALAEWTAPLAVAERAEPVPAGDDLALAAAHVRSDGTGEAAEPAAAYGRLTPGARARLHDERAAELAARGELSLRLGALPYHLEHGSAASTDGLAELRFALNYCLDHGFYQATVDLGRRGLRLIGPDGDPDLWWPFTGKVTTSLAALGRAEEAEALYADVLARTDRPDIHMQAAYAVGMLYTRHHEQQHQNHLRAKGQLQQAIAFASVLFTGAERAFRVVFNRNGLALVESHLKHPEEALRLVTEGLSWLDNELDPAEHRLHRSVLRYNRAQVLAGLGRLAEALADFDQVIEIDPNYPEYHFDRANLLHRMGRDEEALDGYAAAIRLGPPFPEVFYNRAELLLAAGAEDEALAGFGYVLELDPDCVDARVNRAGILLVRGELDAAAADVAAGLRTDPGHAHLHLARGQLLAARAENREALAALDAAVAADPALISARAARATVHFELGDLDAALSDLDAAVAAEPANAELRYNRAVLHQAAGRREAALADLTEADQLAPGDEDIIAALSEYPPNVPSVGSGTLTPSAL